MMNGPRRYRLTVRTEPSQGLNTGSIPVSATNSSITYGQCAVTRCDPQRASRISKSKSQADASWLVKRPVPQAPVASRSGCAGGNSGSLGQKNLHARIREAPAPSSRCAISAESAVSLRYPALPPAFQQEPDKRPPFLLTTELAE